MRITNAEKLSMCKEHVIDRKSLSHISERYDKYDLGRLKYLINLYKRYGEEPFINREDGIYKRDTKLLSINCTELKKREWFVISYAYRKGESQCQVIEVNTLPI